MFLILSILLLINWRGQLIGGVLFLASLLSTLLFTILAIYPLSDNLPSVFVQLLEVARNTAWLMFLYVVLSRHSVGNSAWSSRLVLSLICGLPILMTLLIFYHTSSENTAYLTIFGINLEYIANISIALLGLLLVEKLYRSTKPEGRWALKFMCLGLGGIYMYDLFLFSDSVLFKRLDFDLVDVRGAINAICVPLIALSVARNPDWKMGLFVSRQVVYHSTAAMAAGIYLIIMATAGYYVRTYGGEWGPRLQIVFLFGAVIILIILFFSTELRARLKIFLAKHFYKNKYDYREEWLRFARTLADNKDNSEIYRTIIKAVADVIKSPGGALYLLDSGGYYVLADKIDFHDEVNDEVSSEEDFVQFMKNNRWIINIDDNKTSINRFSGTEIPEWITSSGKIWLILPLYNEGLMSGFMMLVRPHGNAPFDWEDIDLMKSVGFQTAAFIALLRTTDALSEARQFETFNRLSAFMVHDIKNIVAQLTFVTSNFSKYRENPEFLNDAVETITHAADKMKNLLGYLGKDQVIIASNMQKLDLYGLVVNIINRRRIINPEPILKNLVPGLTVQVDKDKLVSALEHLIQNAQEAVDENGSVTLSIERENGQAKLMISDNGCGMDEEFIKKRLFKPFDTTKGNAGMGIGVYESREYIREIGGRIKVASHPGKGTVFTIMIPCLDEVTDQG